MLTDLPCLTSYIEHKASPKYSSEESEKMADSRVEKRKHVKEVSRNEKGKLLPGGKGAKRCGKS